MYLKPIVYALRYPILNLESQKNTEDKKRDNKKEINKPKAAAETEKLNDSISKRVDRLEKKLEEIDQKLDQILKLLKK